MEGKVEKVESCSSDNYISRILSTEICPEFFHRSIWWCNFLFPLYASSELTNNIICFDFWSWTRNTHSMRLYYLFVAYGSILIPGKKFPTKRTTSSKVWLIPPTVHIHDLGFSFHLYKSDYTLLIIQIYITYKWNWMDL